MKTNKRTYRPAADDEDNAVSWLSARSGWFFGVAGGVSLLFHAAVIVALFLSGYAFAHSSYALTQKEYTQDAQLAATPFSHVILGAVPLSLTLPANLSPYIGKLYHVDCGSDQAHTVTIAPGSTSWLNGSRVATCLGLGSGFSFRVISSTGIRLLDPRDISFT